MNGKMHGRSIAPLLSYYLHLNNLVNIGNIVFHGLRLLPHTIGFLLGFRFQPDNR